MLQITTDANNDDAMSRLRNSIFLKLVKMRIDSIPRVFHTGKYLLKRRSFICTRQTANILSNKPTRPELLQNSHSILVKWAIVSVNSFMFTDNGKIVAREAKGKAIYRSKSPIIEVKLPHVTTNHAFRVISANVLSIGFAGLRIIIVCPCMINSESVALNLRT